MPNPFVFCSESELVGLLSQDATRSKAESFYSSFVNTVAEVVMSGVTGNTFRAFRNLPVQPSVAFRKWAVDYIQETQKQLENTSEASEYATYVHEATLSLCTYWQAETGSDMGYGRGAKLFNLVLKKFACLQSLSEEQRQILIELQHVPLDSYTIVGLHAIAPDLSIPLSATMKYVESRAQYSAFQERITQIARKAGVPPIYYDILAWDIGHQQEARIFPHTGTSAAA